MAPFWLLRLNDLLAWLNPFLGLVASAPAALVIVVAVERSPGRAANAPIQTMRPVQAASAADCQRVTLPPEWKDLLLHD